jgi:hypothetical protein
VNRIQPVHLHAQGPAVADLQAGLLFLIHNQSGISDNDRRLLEQQMAPDLRDQVYQTGTAGLVTLFQGQLTSRFQIVVNGDVDEATAEVLNIALAELGAFSTPPGDTTFYDVAGTVSSPGNASVGGLLVQIVDKNAGSDVVLGETKTDDRGHYHLRFSAATFTGGKTRPDLQARVFAETFLAASEIHHNATNHETLDVRWVVAAPPGAIPDQIQGPALAGFLTARMAGTPSDGSEFQGSPPASVVWVDAGDEVLVHLDSIKTQVTGQSVVVSIDLETEQTGRTPVIVVFALGADDQVGLIAATDEYPRGDGALVARWGAAVQAAAWSALLSLASDHAKQSKLTPRGLAVVDGQLRPIAGQALKVAPP